jgi:hypothetical protein
MARQLSEQLEREVSAEELLKIQNKPNPNAQLPNAGVAFDPGQTPSIAPPSEADSPADVAASPVIAPAQASTPPPVKMPHPTSAAAMHAADVSPQAELALSDPLSPATDPIHTPHE